MDLKDRLTQVDALTEKFLQKKEELVRITVGDLGFTCKDSEKEIDLFTERMRSFSKVAELLAGRRPLCRKGQDVALLLPYDGSTWMNTAILSTWMAGNRVRVKFSRKGSRVARFTEEAYRPIFGDEIRFVYQSGRKFMEKSLADPDVPALCIFGSDRHVLPYYEDFRRTGKKLIFEGPGNDPFIILEGADLDAALSDLAEAKYGYSGQTCVAPERILVHESLYETFLNKFSDITRGLKVGSPDDPAVEVAPLASSLAVQNIRRFLEDALNKGGRIICGGKIEDSLVYPTIVADANEFMWGMRDEIFGPVSFVACISSPEEAVRIAKANRYGLRATIYGKEETAFTVAKVLKGENYLHEVPEFVIGRFGTVSVNEPRSISWRDALITKPIGGYAYSGWVWETVDNRFIMKQGPRLFSLETSLAS